VAKINLALSSLPAFRGVSDPSALAGRIHIGPELDYLERAFDCVKYGEVSTASVARHHDSVDRRHGTDAQGRPRCVDLHALRAIRASGASQDVAKDVLLNNTLGTLDTYAPGIRTLVVGAEVLTPAELQKALGLSGGHMFHGELALDQLFTMRPILGHAGYAGPIRGLYLCGAGTHPGDS
jgi:phytoene dehydrogenase-like protein